MQFIYRFDDLIKVLDALIESRALTYRTVCSSTGIHPSYFSRVMKREGSFSQNQIYKLCDILGLNEESTDYLFLLWQKHQATQRGEKDLFAKKIRKVTEEKLKITSRTFSQSTQQNIGIYHDEAITAQVHMYLTIRKYSDNPQLVRERLHLSESKFQSELNKLENLGLLRRNKSFVQDVKDFLLLEDGSPLTPMNHINWRLKAIQNLELREKKSGDYHFSAVFSANEETKLLLKQRLRDLVIEAQSLVEKCSEPDGVHHFLVDLF
jgi:uncharacterized protein (TIGR02147 family)